MLGRVAPGLLASWSARRTRRHIAGFEQRLGLWETAARLASMTGSTVMAGPFAGMAYPATVAQRHGAPKLVGSYEQELHPVVERLAAHPPSRVVDIGAAEGYYAVGLALRMPQAHVVGFETDPEERAQSQAMARLNGVADRLALHGRCTPARLGDALVPGAVVVCDCEGYEAVLLDPVAVPGLASCTILVELHEQQAPGVTALMRARFGATHAETLVTAEPRDPDAYPLLSVLPPAERARAVNEFRHDGQQWLLWDPRP